MAKAAKSFAEKAAKAQKKEERQFSLVKYVKSVISEETHHVRFQETMLKVPTGMTVSNYLKKLEQESKPQ